MNDTVDLLRIKIEKAKRELPLETINAINAVDWKASLLELRTKKGYTFEQLGDLELETELLLSGLVGPAEYPKELEKRMGISKGAVNELLNEMNEGVFKKIREELIKNSERKRMFAEGKKDYRDDANVLDDAGIKVVEPTLPTRTIDMRTEKPTESREDILKKIEKPELILRPEEISAHPILAQKLSGSFQTGVVKTEHTLENITKKVPQSPISSKPKIPYTDPYREVPE